MEKGVDKELPAFYNQVNLFKNLGNVTLEYMESIQNMKQSLKKYNSALLQFCDSDWKEYTNFKNVLVDGEDLYTLLEDDIAKLGDGFQQFGDGFYLVLETRQNRKLVQKELNNLKYHMEKILHSKRTTTEEKERAVKMVKKKEKECRDIEKMILQRMESLRKSYKSFLHEHYGNFISAHTEFYRDCLTVHDIAMTSINSLVSKKKKI